MEDSCERLQIDGDVAHKWVVQQNNIEPVQIEALSY